MEKVNPAMFDTNIVMQVNTTLTPEQAYQYALQNGYAGVLGWTWTNHDGNGGTFDAAPGMLKVLQLAPELVKLPGAREIDPAAKLFALVEKKTGGPWEDFENGVSWMIFPLLPGLFSNHLSSTFMASKAFLSSAFTRARYSPANFTAPRISPAA